MYFLPVRAMQRGLKQALCIPLKDKFKYLQSEISVINHSEFGASIKLIDYEHRDYIEDVITEHFDIEIAFISKEDVTKDYVLFFSDNSTFEEVKNVVKQINLYHKSNSKLYKTV